MRSLVVTENITLDGVIEATQGWFAPTGSEDPDDFAELSQVTRRHMASADALLLGRTTFEQFRGYWPNQKDDQTGVTDYLNAVSKYVISATLQEPGWDRTTVLRGPLVDEVTALKQQPGADVVVTGSVQLVQALTGTGLVDEYRLFVFPVVLGRGARLFADATDVGRLDLVEAHPVPLRHRADPLPAHLIAS